MTDNNSIQSCIHLLEAKKSQTLANLQKKIIFNVTSFYDFVLHQLDTLNIPNSTRNDLNPDLGDEIAKAVDFYQIPLKNALKDAFNLTEIFPFLDMTVKQPNSQKQQPTINSRHTHPTDGSEQYISDYSTMIECEIKSDDDQGPSQGSDSSENGDNSDQNYILPSKDPSGSGIARLPPSKRPRPKGSSKKASTSSRQYSCTELACGKVFASRVALTMHTMTHTGERPNVCEHCGKAFTQKGALQVHLRAKHTGEMTHACSWPGCTYKAAYGSSVFKHIRLRHFQLPASKREQAFKGIVDDRDAHQYVVDISKSSNSIGTIEAK